MDDLEAFSQLVQALAPWRAHLVFVGGWAHRLHRFHPLANAPEHSPVFTRDTDLAFHANAPLHGDIRDALRAHGFEEVLGGDARPPAAHYAWGDAQGGFYAEFLTPLAGSGRRRSGEIDATLAKAGITAQKIRDLDILLLDPWMVTLGEEDRGRRRGRMDVLVADPLCFMIQKFLIQRHRAPGKRAQDVLYIHDTIELFGGQIEEFGKRWRDVVAPRLGGLADDVRTAIRATFAGVDDTLREAARIPAGRALTAEQIQASCRYALELVVG